MARAFTGEIVGDPNVRALAQEGLVARPQTRDALVAVIVQHLIAGLRKIERYRRVILDHVEHVDAVRPSRWARRRRRPADSAPPRTGARPEMNLGGKIELLIAHFARVFGAQARNEVRGRRFGLQGFRGSRGGRPHTLPRTPSREAP